MCAMRGGVGWGDRAQAASFSRKGDPSLIILSRGSKENQVTMHYSCHSPSQHFLKPFSLIYCPVCDFGLCVLFFFLFNLLLSDAKLMNFESKSSLLEFTIAWKDKLKHYFLFFLAFSPQPWAFLLMLCPYVKTSTFLF